MAKWIKVLFWFEMLGMVAEAMIHEDLGGKIPALYWSGHVLEIATLAAGSYIFIKMSVTVQDGMDYDSSVHDLYMYRWFQMADSMDCHLCADNSCV